MATTKTKTKTREEELAEQLEHHRSELATLERQATDADDHAAELEARVEARIADVDGSLTDLPKSIEDDRNQAQRKRQMAIDLRARAQAYATRVELAAIAAEHNSLREERIAAGQLEAAMIEAKALGAEDELLVGWLFRSDITEGAVKARHVEIAERLIALEGKYGTGIRVGIDVNWHIALPATAAHRASVYLREIAYNPDPNFWRRNLPDLDPKLALPVELRAGPVNNASHGQREVPPPPRNPAGIMTSTGRWVPVPATEAETRAKRAKIAAAIAAEDEAVAAVEAGG